MRTIQSIAANQIFEKVKTNNRVQYSSICDFLKTEYNLIVKDVVPKEKLFTKVTLSAEELKLYEQIYNYLSIDLPTPDLVIYLQAETKTLYERVMHRGIEMEKTISFDYLDLLNETYKEFFFDYERSPVLIVNSDYLDLQANKSDYNLLLGKLLDYFNKPEGTKMYFNPSPALI